MLRIDDDMRAVRPKTDGGFDYNLENPPEGIQSLEFEFEGLVCVGIANWRLAIAYWEQFNAMEMPDLVVGDVRFAKDTYSPLNFKMKGVELEIPTGLSHVKPFAAINRALGKPIGVAIHTKSHKIWKEIFEKESSKARRMALLAAHEIGELASILGEQLDFPEDTDQSTFEKCWVWLHLNTKQDFKPAAKVAISNYRKRLLDYSTGRKLGGVKVLPADWALMRRWAKKMSEEPKPLNEKNDIGVTYLLPSGKRETIFFHSIFADSNFELSEDPLPASCYELIEDREPERLDSSSLPKIGAFIEKLSSLYLDYKEAVDFVSRLPPCSDEQTNCSPIGTTMSEQAKALVIFFQLLRRDHHNFHNVWCDIFSNWRWDRKQLKIVDDQDPSNSLSSHLSNLLDRMPIGKRFDVDDFGGKTWCGNPVAVDDVYELWFQFHVDRLIESGAVSKLDDGYLLRKEGRVLDVPGLPAEIIGDVGLVGQDAAVFLRDSLGYWQKPDNWSRDIGKDIANGFGLDGDSEGRNFRDNFLTGKAPHWLIEICQEFARNELEWVNEAGWPTSIRH